MISRSSMPKFSLFIICISHFAIYCSLPAETISTSTSYFLNETLEDSSSQAVTTDVDNFITDNATTTTATLLNNSDDPMFLERRRLLLEEETTRSTDDNDKTKPLRILYTVTTLSEYDKGTRATTRGFDRLMKTLVPVVKEGVISMIDMLLVVLREQYKLENGKYVVPSPIESAIGMSRFINQVILCGANRSHNVALLVPEWPAIRIELGIKDDVTDEELTNDSKLKDLIDNEIIQSCDKLKRFEIPKNWAFVAPFTAANNMLTPKMSIRRHVVMDAYEELISHMYDDDPIVTEAADGHIREAA
ncbi:hypothetical protein FRACYDRAFT_250536 [Fragilariopsis cylindrus CCMP1102]|uniref:AMP-dependent synthetase/ligase domain-containing protein n=1 Tax=Fragilariopsis cylindrus CCMP1102 TaxID=635003 RepID=A0A1E7EPQ4_9STRA|nr:hypothetical protein FRACYDRAFT_250536 [Fragilariopsis cylindrus CCMP1102]|eukprot:OEU07911.1 hypothetical protein FRACYDRAFT_250536 [Fragilariopsis cylindrus CCMP1102]